MELIVDTNVAIAAILRKGITRNLIFNSSLLLCCPEILFTEIQKHSPGLLEKYRIDPNDFESMVNLVSNQILVLSLESYIKFKGDALSFTPDRGDWPFFAAALSRGCALWSNDKILKEQRKVKVYSTGDLLKLLNRGERLL